ncbi:recombinase family protein [Cupriavidus sp. D39]|uniref:recombinase family protein n=1 Tax=Cupriavidus sp. D39 TaxID=2997877 RepID=UPI002271DEA6|nr:recombinase family protein [Cupriavidus sp. D39]MCY0856448.1 recombinase family protein [Cupriavidus sp. D39]
MSAGKRVAYVRVSTVDQNTDRQLEGVAVDKTFTDKASGKDIQRPQLQAALDYVREGDTLVVHSMDRLARNTEDLLRMVRELTAKHVSVEFVKERLTFSGQSDDPMATLMMTMLGGFAQFERSLIRERQREGIAIAREKGVYKGRKAALNLEQVATLKQRAAAGDKKAAIARDLGISRETLYQYLRQAEGADAGGLALGSQS